MLINFLQLAKQKELKNKIILNCTYYHRCKMVFEELKELLEELEEKNNIPFYFPGCDMHSFVKHNNVSGFNY